MLVLNQDRDAIIVISENGITIEKIKDWDGYYIVYHKDATQLVYLGRYDTFEKCQKIIEQMHSSLVSKGSYTMPSNKAGWLYD